MGLDSDNGIIVQRYALKRSIDESNLDLAKSEFDALVAGLSPDARKARPPRWPVRSVERGQRRLVVLFDGRTEFLINCQSTPEKRSQIDAAYDLAVETLEREGS